MRWLTGRLYHQIYAAFVAIALLCLISAGVTWRLMSDATQWEVPPQAKALAARTLAGVDDSAALDEVARSLDLRATLWAADGSLIAASGDPLPAPDPGHRRGGEGWVHSSSGPALRVQLDDGRWLAVSDREHGHPGPPLRGALALLALAGAAAAGCWPLSRRITRRVERLQAQVDRWGEGALGSRVPVDGCDEIADLARSFNSSAERIEALVQAQRRVLASTSHELRSPLARLRMALAFLEDDDPERRELLAEAERDIDELDAVIGDLLQVGRMEASEGVERPEPVDLRALAAEEAARVGAAIALAPGDERPGGRPGAGPEAQPGALIVQGDHRLLRRALRNLLENAARYGGGSTEVRLQRGEGEARVLVLDRGPGVPEGWAERIFEPFSRPPGHREGADGGVGLGLALVRQIAEHHGGRARYRPREGGGSVFELAVPV